jgi:CubicO group peptidase (beta-lactamase class C family)
MDDNKTTMRKLTLLIAFAFLFNMAGAQQKDPGQLSAEFDKILTQHFKAGEPGATALVARNGQVIYKKAFGMSNIELEVPMQPDNIFRIGSITKQFTAVAILQLMEQGKLSLQDEITKFIPDYPTQGNKITIEHLLTHTSGIESYTRMKDYKDRMPIDMKPEEMIDHFKNEPMRFTPGTRWEYSNSGYFLLGYIIEKVTGKTYPEYLEENIFKPVGMSSSLYGSNSRIIKNRVGTYRAGENGFENALPLSMTQPYAAGSIQSTVEDLFKWHQSLHAYKLLKKENLDKAFTSYVLPDGKPTGYGYGWELAYIQDSPTIEHGGGINGNLTMAIYLPKEDVFVAVFSGCECNPPGDIAAKLAAAAIEKPYDQKEMPLDIPVLKAYTGVYENEKGEQRVITLSDKQLYSQRGRNPKFAVRPYEKDKFFIEDALLSMEFSRNKKGKIEKLITKSRSGNEVWTKTDKPVATQVVIKVDKKLLESYQGEYEIAPNFTFTITKEQDKLFVQATGQEKYEIFAETKNKFFMKETDAAFEFVRDDSGNVTKALLRQSGRTTDAKKIK